MSTPTVDQNVDPQAVVIDAGTDAGAEAGFDPFALDIRFIENTPAADTILMCATNDTCGSSCPSACTTS